jgi:hypothetical protein
MSKGIFTDKQHQPRLDEVFAVLGSKGSLWEELTEHIWDNYRVNGELKFYGRNYGWAMRFRKGGKALLSLYPNKGGLVVQIILRETDVDAALKRKLGKKVREAIEAAHPYPEGRWVFINIGSSRDVKDVRELLKIKSPVPRQQE